MSVSLFFGLPGSGKTTLLTKFAYKFVKGKKYKNVYTNVHLAIPGVIYIDNDCIGRYDLRDGVLLVDEATLFADSRAWKEFDKSLVQFFMLHRHYRVDMYLFSQGWDAVDKKIRTITDRVFYIYKSGLLSPWVSKYYRIPYGIIIPDPKKGTGDKLGEIIQGYCKPPLLVRLFASRCFRPRWYKYFDSFECPKLPSLPARYHPYGEKLVTAAAPMISQPNSFSSLEKNK